MKQHASKLKYLALIQIIYSTRISATDSPSIVAAVANKTIGKTIYNFAIFTSVPFVYRQIKRIENRFLYQVLSANLTAVSQYNNETNFMEHFQSWFPFDSFPIRIYKSFEMKKMSGNKIVVKSSKLSIETWFIM